MSTEALVSKMRQNTHLDEDLHYLDRRQAFGGWRNKIEFGFDHITG